VPEPEPPPDHAAVAEALRQLADELDAIAVELHGVAEHLRRLADALQ
jgi:hypothetical protein